MTDIMFTRTALTEAAKEAEVTTAQARTILERAGVKVEPEKPDLPTEPGSVIIATEVRGKKGEWRFLLDEDRDWYSPELINGRTYHSPEDITAWTPVRVVPAAAAPVALTGDQVGEEWNHHKPEHMSRWEAKARVTRTAWTSTVNTLLSKYAAPAEGELIDVRDVREGDRVRVELEGGDEATFTVTGVGMYGLCSHSNAYDFDTIRAVYLLHREEA